MEQIYQSDDTNRRDNVNHYRLLETLLLPVYLYNIAVKMDKNLGFVLENQAPSNKDKNMSCWARFKSLFEDRGFDLEYEYPPRNPRPINLLGEDQETEGYRRIEDRKASLEHRLSNSAKEKHSNSESNNVDGELSGVINFYEQFAILVDDTKEETTEVFTRKSVRHRVSMRPSAILTNIMEEGEGELDDIEVVSKDYLNARVESD